MMKSWRSLLLMLAVLTPGLVGCGTPDSVSDGRLRIVTSFYPLQYVAGRVAGGHAEVENLTQSGIEPHDLELTVAQSGWGARGWARGARSQRGSHGSEAWRVRRAGGALWSVTGLMPHLSEFRRM